MNRLFCTQNWMKLGVALCLGWLLAGGNAWGQPALGTPSAGFRQYDVRHAPVSQVEAALRRMFPDEGEIYGDVATNRLAVRGPEELQRLVAQMLETLDRPVVANAEPRPAVLRAYQIPAAELADTAARLESRFPPATGVRIGTDPRTSQLLIMAPLTVHAEIDHGLRLGAPPRLSVGPVMATPPPFAAPEMGPVRHTVQPFEAAPQTAGKVIALRYLTWQNLEAALRQLKAQLTSAVDQPVVSYQLKGKQGESVELVVDRRLHQVAIRGTGTAARDAAQLVQTLDAAANQPAGKTQIVPVQYAPAKQVHLAADAVGNRAAHSTAAIIEAAGLDRKPPVPMLARVFQGNQPPTNQPPPNQPPASQPPPNVPSLLENPSLPPSETAPNAGQSGPARPVQIEYLEGLDMFIIRGPRDDVESVKRLIEDIERISSETEPVIELYTVQHVDGVNLSTLVTQLYDQVLSPRQGRVSITPLVKPNALLLIGRADSVKTVMDLIQRLDQPVGPATQFETFRLVHASAQAIQQTITEFFANRTGLGTKLLVTADFRSNSVIVQASPRDMAEVSLLIKKLDVADSDAVNELKVFKLKNSLAEELAPILQSAINSQAAQAGRTGIGGQQVPGAQTQTQGVGGVANQNTLLKSTVLRMMTVDPRGHRKLESGILTDVRVTADPRVNALLVTAPPQSMELITTLIDQLDQSPAAISQIKVFTIINGDATGLVSMLESLFGQTQTGGQARGLQAAGGIQGETSLIPIRFSVDERTNSIVASGSAGDLNVVEAILLRLDDSDVRQRQSQVYRLKNAPATDVANAINELLRSERDVQQLAPTTISPFEQIEREVIVVPEPVSNSLIVSATPRYFQEISALVEKLDERPPMVMIQVLIAEVVLNNTDEFGVELGIQDSLLFDRSLIGDLVTTTTSTVVPGVGTVQTTNVVSSTATPGFNFNNQPLGNNGSTGINRENLAGQAITNFAVGRVNSQLGYGGLVLSGGSESLSFLLRALQECRRLDVLSRPQVMTLDNQPAFIQVGQRVPRVTGTSTNEVGQTNTVTLENVGLILGVTPRISPDNLVVMEIDAEKSAVGPLSEGIPISISANGQVITSPRIDTITAQTTVSALTGQTIVLGGLISKRTFQTKRRVPMLSSIPVLGNFLFRYDSTTSDRAELLIILTPHIVRTEEDAEILKQEEAARINWCLADVHKMHGDTGIRGKYDTYADFDTPVIYPDENPTGLPVHPAEPKPMPVLTPPGDIPPAGPAWNPQGKQTPQPTPATPRQARREKEATAVAPKKFWQLR